MVKEAQQPDWEARIADLPSLKAFDTMMEDNLRADEFLGPDNDIIVIGGKPDELPDKQMGVLFFGNKFKFMSSSDDCHAAGARIISSDLMQKTESAAAELLTAIPTTQEILPEAIRFDVELDGADRHFIVDLDWKDDKVAKVTKLFKDLGVPEDRINFTKSGFQKRDFERQIDE
jgi:hypothetical protein